MSFLNNAIRWIYSSYSRAKSRQWPRAGWLTVSPFLLPGLGVSRFMCTSTGVWLELWSCSLLVAQGLTHITQGLPGDSQIFVQWLLILSTTYLNLNLFHLEWIFFFFYICSGKRKTEILINFSSLLDEFDVHTLLHKSSFPISEMVPPKSKLS